MNLFYRYMVCPALLLLSYLASPFFLKLKSYFQERKNYESIVLNTVQKIQNPIWIHISSGEIEYAKPFIEILKGKHPILITYFSTSVLSNLKKIDGICYLPSPIDMPSKLNFFISKIKPRALFIAKTDVWPEMLYQTKKANIPSYLFSATLSQKNLKTKNFLFRSIFKSIYSNFNKIYCVTNEDKAQLKKIYNGEIVVSGDFRYLQVLKRKSHTKLKYQIQKSKPVFILASSWQEDESELYPEFQKILSMGFSIIWAPHEIYDANKKIKKIKSDFSSLNILTTKEQTSDFSMPDILFVNEIGILADLYKYSDIAFIGGSFKKQVHSVMEALAFGNYVFVGPKHHNNREALDFKQIGISNLKVVQELESGGDIYAYIEDWKKNKEARPEKVVAMIEDKAVFAKENLHKMLDLI